MLNNNIFVFLLKDICTEIVIMQYIKEYTYTEIIILKLQNILLKQIMDFI